MSLIGKLGTDLLFFDGAMGTQLQARGLAAGENPDVWSITHPDTVFEIHSAYLNAGCDIIKTNTFGCTDIKLADTGYHADEIARAAVSNARRAIDSLLTTRKRYAALSIGPTGKLLEPMGELGFEDAVKAFSVPMIAGAAAGADLILIETMSDTLELKAAVLAAKENTNLPVFATVTLDETGHMLNGGNVYSVTALLEGLHVDAFGLNCGMGPDRMIPFLSDFAAVSSTPVILNPNAGIPREENGCTVFDVGSAEFADILSKAASLGAHILGGCCGTTPEHIRALIESCKGIKPVPLSEKGRTVVSSYARTVVIGGKTTLVGERINPTGKPKLKKALLDGDYEFVQQEAIAQREEGAEILDVNVGVPGIDEPAVLTECIKRIQSACDLPLQLDSSEPEALERAMRIYNGKPMVNSVNGKEESMNTILPLVAKYGGTVVALALDEAGIAETAAGRLSVVRKIVDRAQSYGIEKKEIIVDALVMTASAGSENARTTLDALALIRRELGVKTILGVSNISFGLPARGLLNSSFFAMALATGLDAAIVNPASEDMMAVYDSAQALLGYDEQCLSYIAKHADDDQKKTYALDTTTAGTKSSHSGVTPRSASGNSPDEGAPHSFTLKDAIIKGLKEKSAALTAEVLISKSPLEVINGYLAPALDIVGAGFDKGDIYLPQLLLSANAAKASFEVIKSKLEAEGTVQKMLGTVVLATVQGDVHDIGKNIVRALLENYQFEVLDLGKDVQPETVLDAVKTSGAKLVGLSALMTTTVGNMKMTINLVKKMFPDTLFMVGGAVLTEEYALQIGADRYGSDAMSAVRIAQEVYTNQSE
jgi:5-methyltetrahydrofolate--homocysteine methyltransferase